MYYTSFGVFSKLVMASLIDRWYKIGLEDPYEQPPEQRPQYLSLFKHGFSEPHPFSPPRSEED